MKKIVVIIAIFFGMLSDTGAQVRETPYGVIVNENRNLRLINSEVKKDSAVAIVPKQKVQTIISGKLEMSFGNGYVATGGAVSVGKLLKHWGYGGEIGTAYSPKWGWASRAGLYVQCGTASDALQGISFRASGGYAQTHVTTAMMTSGGEKAHRKSSSLKPYAGLEVIYNLNLSPSWVLTAGVGVRHSFIKKSDDKSQVLSGNWLLDYIKTETNRYFVNVGIAKHMTYASQISGDNCWLLEGLYGTSNLGQFTGSRFVNFKRKGATYGRILGFGAEGYKDRGNTLSKIYLMGGVRYIPMGASGHIAFDGGAMVGVGDFPQRNVTALTKEDGGKSLSKIGNYYQFGGDIRLYSEISANWGPIVVGGGAFVGPYSLTGNNYHGDKGFSGDEGKTSGIEKGVYGKIAFAF